jgi:voltage-gated potassium channel
MILGYSIIAVPTGIVTAELVHGHRGDLVTTRTCPSCLTTGHARRARYCYDCGEPMQGAVPQPPGEGDAAQ